MKRHTNPFGDEGVFVHEKDLSGEKNTLNHNFNTQSLMLSFLRKLTLEPVKPSIGKVYS